MPDGQNHGPDSPMRDADGGAMSRDSILETIDAALAARTRGDKEAVAGFLAPRLNL
jgi:hypothetical protein